MLSIQYDTVLLSVTRFSSAMGMALLLKLTDIRAFEPKISSFDVHSLFIERYTPIDHEVSFYPLPLYMMTRMLIYEMLEYL
jgi:hypothetical protein